MGLIRRKTNESSKDTKKGRTKKKGRRPRRDKTSKGFTPRVSRWRYVPIRARRGGSSSSGLRGLELKPSSQIGCRPSPGGAGWCTGHYTICSPSWKQGAGRASMKLERRVGLRMRGRRGAGCGRSVWWQARGKPVAVGWAALRAHECCCQVRQAGRLYQMASLGLCYAVLLRQTTRKSPRETESAFERQVALAWLTTSSRTAQIKRRRYCSYKFGR